MNPESKKIVRQLINGHLKAIKNKDPKNELKEDSSLLGKNLMRDKQEINRLLKELKKYYYELLPVVKSFRVHINDIIENSHVCAIYLLLCQTFQNWNAFFELVDANQSSAATILIRSIKESVALIELFSLEYSTNDRKNLDKWFKGEIISHKTCREKQDKLFKQIMPRVGNDMGSLNTYLYSMESQAPHNSYSSILESISPFTEDFDFEEYTRSYRTVAITKYAIGSMTAVNISMKMATILVLKNPQILTKIEKILLKYNH